MKMMKNLSVLGLILGMLAFGSGVFAEPVNINKADAKTLAKSVKGIGPVKAEAIVAYRKQNGPFKTLQDLTKVKGIGQKFIVKNQQDLQLSDAAVRKAAK